MKVIKAKYSKNILDGRYEVYNENKLIERGKYELGRKERLWVRYYENGIMKSARYYKNDKLDGFYYLYNKKGEIITKREFYNGKKIKNL